MTDHTSRTATAERKTSESGVRVRVNLDGTGESTVSTGVGFFDHMLTSLSRHSLIDLEIEATGDVWIDAHHVVEDTAIVLGQALREAFGDKRGIRRFGDALVPLDEALAQCVVDIAGRPYCVHSGEPDAQAYAQIGGGPWPDGTPGTPYVGSMTRHIVETLAFNAGICIHLTLVAGRDPHHIVEAQVKALARALRTALEPDGRIAGVPSTKGAL
ncbi:imidazoleglycerol-phosphate dehydratase HisB [Granulicoccus sp. GXG6511]|uniref:imidazoleglycerol-phosphate dehydratase HisB n=1 Tax=Granulicoccus sp. GXG6511 TaxID=3381351 RepID=UPI003D7DAB2D